MSIKEELIKQRNLIVKGGEVEVNLYKVKTLFNKYYLKEEEAEKNYQILIKCWNDNHGNYGAHDSFSKRQRVVGLLNVMIEDIGDSTTNTVLDNAKSKQMKIFISHSSQNKHYGELLVELLRGVGLKENEIIFTSNVAYGIPVAKNIFDWLKSQIQEKPFVIYLLSEQYYKSIACMNEMGAAWIVENEHVAIFTPDFDLTIKEFQNGALDPREIGFFINDADRIFTFIEVLSEFFDITRKTLTITQCVKKFMDGINLIEKELKNIVKPNKTIEIKESSLLVNEEKKTDKESSLLPIKIYQDDLYSKFILSIENNKLKTDELLLLRYLIDTSRIKLKTGWQEEEESSNIREWEKIMDIKNILSDNYAGVLRRFELRGFTEVSAVTSSFNPKEVKLKDEIASQILDFPSHVLNKIDEVVKNSHFENMDFDDDDDDLPF